MEQDSWACQTSKSLRVFVEDRRSVAGRVALGKENIIFFLYIETVRVTQRALEGGHGDWCDVVVIPAYSYDG
jgi:hypothetical protein